MRLGVIPESLYERLILWLGLAPTPLADTQVGFLLARTVMVATKLGVFEALAEGRLSAPAVAARCGLDDRGAAKLLSALAGAHYLVVEGSDYALTPIARKWLLKDASRSLHDKMLLQFLEWEFVEHFENYVRTGRPIAMHTAMTDEQWRLYQRGMRSMAGLSTDEVARRTPVPGHARALLDVGGSHGLYAAAFCRRYPKLRAVILDLPEALDEAQAILAEENVGERVAHRAGNALTDDLGEAAWDVVFISSLVHHFSEAENRDLTKRVVRALRPGGVFVIQELIRPASPKEAAKAGFGPLLDLYFAATSQSGTWSLPEMAAWQREAGLVPLKPLWLRTLPGSGQQSAVKR